MKGLAEVLCVLATAVGLILSAPGFGLPWVAWCALAPLLYVVRRVGPGRACLASFAAGFGFFSYHLQWALEIKGFDLFNYTLCNLGSAGWVGLFGLCASWLHRRLPGCDVVTLPSAWVLIEYVKLHAGFLAFPWGILAHTQYEVLPVIQIAGLTGVYGVSFLVVMVNVAIAGVARRSIFGLASAQGARSRRSLVEPVATAFVVSGCLLYGVARLAAPVPEAEGPRVALVQGNAFWSGSRDDAARHALLARYRRLTLQAARNRPDLIAWPSDSVPALLPLEQDYGEVVAEIARASGTHLLVGSSGQEKFDALPGKVRDPANSAFLFTPAGEVAAHYDKIHLLPFDEYLPLRDTVAWPDWIARSRPSDFRAGTELTVFTVAGARFGVLICWENLFPDLFRRMAGQDLDFMVSMTNEGFAGASPAAHEQMLAMNALRAVESGLPIARTSPTGISAFLDGNGRITARFRDRDGEEVGVEGLLVGAIQPSHTVPTLYTQAGDWFVAAIAVVLCALGLAPIGVPRLASGARKLAPAIDSAVRRSR